MLFGERSAILVDPGEEKLKSEFAGVKRSYIPMQSIIRIDEVEKQGAAKISEGGDSGKIATFPMSPTAPRALLRRVITQSQLGQLCGQNRAAWRWVSFNRLISILRIQEVGQRVEGHPVR